jgi:metal-sulfur cluster biosynthetic enzyme
VMVSDAAVALRESFPNVSSIRVDLVRDGLWSPDQMTDDARRQLGMV